VNCSASVQGFCPTGDASGTLTFDNGTGFNDYFDGFTFVTTSSFQVSLYGPALSSPNCQRFRPTQRYSEKARRACSQKLGRDD